MEVCEGIPIDINLWKRP